MKPPEFPAAVESTARRFDMDLSRPLAMVSGGPDSVALLRALAVLGTRPVVLHVDHGLRGEESRGDAWFVRDLCEDLEVPYEERRAELGGGNLQEEARNERYRFAEEVADERGLSCVATGHTADDVAETVLMNLARGAGLRGLSGIPPVRGRVARPLIERRRAEVLTYLSRLDQPYRTDPTNFTGKYTRNRVRLEVLPVLEELYPGTVDNIVRTTALLRDDLEVLERLAAGGLLRRGNTVAIPLQPLRPEAVLSRKARHAYSTLLPDAPPLGSVHVEAVLEMARDRKIRRLDLPGGVVVARGPSELSFYRWEHPFFGEVGLDAGVQEFADWLINVREVRGYDPEDASRPEVAYLAAERGPYRARMAREGDTVRPLGLGGTKKVMRAMMDRKVPRDLRRRMPVVVDGFGRVAWVFLGETGEEFKVGGATERALRLEVENIS